MPGQSCLTGQVKKGGNGGKPGEQAGKGRNLERGSSADGEERKVSPVRLSVLERGFLSRKPAVQGEKKKHKEPQISLKSWVTGRYKEKYILSFRT